MPDDRDLISRYGLPHAFWNEHDAPDMLGLQYGPVEFNCPIGFFAVGWRFYFAAHCDQTTVVRIDGGESRSENFAGRLLEKAQLYALRNFQAEAVTARNRIKEVIQRKQAHEQAEILQRRALRERWMAELNIDKQRVIDEVQVGNEASFSRNWEAEAHQVPGEHGLLFEVRRAKKSIEQAQQVWALAVAEVERKEQETRLKEEAAERSRLAAEQLEAERNRVWPSSSIIVGVDPRTGDNVRLDTGKFQHILLGGTTGGGKTVWLHGLVDQLLKAETVERMVIIDLKKFEFAPRYGGHAKVTIYNDIADVPAAFDDLDELMNRREAIMLEKNWRNWKDGRVFVIADEYATIQQFIDQPKKEPSQKATAGRLNDNINRLSQRARSSGIVLICALQKSTADGISSAVRANMGMRVCFPVKTRHSVEAVLDTTVDELPIDPRDLETGHFVIDTGRGEYRHLQTWVPPGFDFDD